MDEDNQDKTMQSGDTCGCDCEMCMKGDHEHCATGMCKWQKKEETSDGGM